MVEIGDVEVFGVNELSPPPSEIDNTLLYIVLTMNGCLLGTAGLFVTWVWLKRRWLKAEQTKQRRFLKFDRVVCKIGEGEHNWSSGNIQMINAADPYDSSRAVPYVVKLDPPAERLMVVPRDEDTIARAEVCFRQDSELWLTLSCLPRRPVKAARRFRVDDRVTCAAKDNTNKSYSVWLAGTVLAVDVSVDTDASLVRQPAAAAKLLLMEREGAGSALCVPYRVRLDDDSIVLVHKDEHWLIRDLTLQPEGVRQGAGGTRCLSRLEKRLASAGDNQWEAIDHATRRVRRCEAPDSDDSDDE